jgi:hypothetical protein
MKFIAQLFLIAGFSLAAIGAGAAPRAAEDPNAVVISTSESAPRVKPQSAKSVQKSPAAKPVKNPQATSTKKSSKPVKSTKKAGKA